MFSKEEIVMKLATESKYEAQSNMSGRVVQATIDPSQLAMLSSPHS